MGVSDADDHGFALDQWLSRASSVGYNLLVYATVVFLLAPLAIVVVISFQQSAYATWPPQAFTTHWYTDLPQQLGYLNIGSALATSVKLAVATGICSTVIGGLAAFAITRYDFRFQTTLETILISPLIYPWIVIGLALLLFFNRVSVALGVPIQLSFWTLLVGHIMFTLPYPIRTIGASLQNYDLSLEEAAQNLGATELESYLRITLPLIQPGIMSGFVFAFILSFNQYIVSLFLSGAQTKTMPLVLFSLFYNTAPATLAAIATLLMAGVLSVILVMEYFFGISDFM
ncbi:ABC transporter permease [Halocalculus aciditolerans]|uniref:ABC transporter permease n=1 Tax=Halocalculus aciditolerans TaxID=1383812 RepID=A0A830FLZ7_9EURY|nr:ABC transporter permease [Halocalculus aciditolerans]GGL65824.1 ABC transporter permease [Halocalculus aciditolerans]